MAEIWGAVAAAAVGAGVSLYGANKQAQANSAAQQANQNAQTQQNNAAWSNYLLQRGIAPTSPVTAGVLPTAGNYTVVNSRLPLWANINPPAATPATNARASSPLFVKRAA